MKRCEGPAHGIKSIIFDGIINFAMIAFVLCAALCLTTQRLPAMALAECALICRAVNISRCYYDGVREKVKRIFRYAAPGAIAVAVIFIAGTYVEEPTVAVVLDYAAKIAVAVMAVPVIIPLTSIEKHLDGFILDCRELTSVQRNIYKITGVLSRLLIIAGFLLVIFLKPNDGIYYESVIIVGCVVWYCREVLSFYCDWNCEIVTADGEPDYDSEPANAPQATGNNGRTISEREVERIVQKIADRWTGREDTSLMLSGGGSIRYSVSAEVVGGTFINYTVNGKLSGVRDEQLSSAYTLLGGKIDKVAFKITEETKNELSKHKLPYSSYDVKVNKGYIE